MCSLAEAWSMLSEDVLDACDDLDRMADVNEHAKRNLVRRDRS